MLLRKARREKRRDKVLFRKQMPMKSLTSKKIPFQDRLLLQ